MPPGNGVSATTKLFWSTAGFAFERPGRYRVDVAVSWSARGVAVGVQNGVDLFVDYPASSADNNAANLVMHADVGTWVALGGEAYHLGEAGRRLLALSETTKPAAARAAEAPEATGAARVLAGFGGLLPNRARLSYII